MTKNIKHIVLAGGCFWGLEDLIRTQPGVVDTEVGYTGGRNANPTYDDHDGHAEAVRIAYDPGLTSYRRLLDFFFQIHNPTTLNQQGNDRGTSYRSAIFYGNEQERKEGEDFIGIVNRSKRWKDPVVTTLEPLGVFYRAEDYHQDYLQKNKGGYTCHAIWFDSYLKGKDTGSAQESSEHCDSCDSCGEMSEKESPRTARWEEFGIALPAALAFIALFIGLQRSGLIDAVSPEGMTYGTVFVVGLIASLSTCMAVVGGLVLSISATSAREGGTLRPQLLFHVGRIAAFFVLGGMIGALGSAFTLTPTMTFVLGLVVALVMLALGINLLGVFPWARKLKPSVPAFISRRARGAKNMTGTLAPLAIGVSTFFLPCGFTQSMQVYTLSTGDFISGGLTMLVFALGTLPVLALVSASSRGIKGSAIEGIFFKAVGLIVIAFALFNLINSLAVIGAISPVFNF